MPLYQLASDRSGYGSFNNYMLRLPGQDIDSRKEDENGLGCIQHSLFKENDESSPTKKIKTYQCGINTKEIGIKLIALADMFDAEFFENLNISKEHHRNNSIFSNVNCFNVAVFICLCAVLK